MIARQQIVDPRHDPVPIAQQVEGDDRRDEIATTGWRRQSC
jgi:hypothetical protein